MSEVLSVLLVLVTLAQVVGAPTMPTRLGQLATFLIALVLGFLFLRSVVEEVRRRAELQALTETLQQTNRELARLDAARAELLSIVSHQLLAPLAAIKGYTQFLQETTAARSPPSSMHT